MPPLLQPPAERAGAGLLQGLPHRVDPVRRGGRVAGAGRGAPADAEGHRQPDLRRRLHLRQAGRRLHRRDRRPQRLPPAGRPAERLRPAGAAEAGVARHGTVATGRRADRRAAGARRGGRLPQPRRASRRRGGGRRGHHDRGGALMPDVTGNVADPHWYWWIIFYFFIGGLAAGAFLMAAISALVADRGNRAVVRIGYLLSAPRIAVCGVLLILGLGEPLRFWHMLWNVWTDRPAFKYWSPMSHGSWLLSGFGLFSGLAFVRAVAEWRGITLLGVNRWGTGPVGKV